MKKLWKLKVSVTTFVILIVIIGLIISAVFDAPTNSIRSDGIGVRSMFIIVIIDVCYVALFIFLVSSFFSLLFGF